MARSSKYVTIEGQFASRVLGTFSIIRGFATLQELAAISAPFPMNASSVSGQQIAGHQRAVDPVHAEAIKRYLEDGSPRYIPEIIPSVRAEFRDDLDGQAKTFGVISDSVAGLTVRRRWKSRNIATHQLRIERSRLSTIIETDCRIRRIDGNHRLHLANELQLDATSPTKYLAPFCLILLGSPGDPNDDYVESMLFHTINSTALPLDSEHALKLVLAQAVQYRSADEEFATNAPLHLTRLLNEKPDLMSAVRRGRLGETPATVLNSAAAALVAQNPALARDRQTMVAFADDLSDAITHILAVLRAEHSDLCRAEFFIELASQVWDETDATANHETRLSHTVATLRDMGRWLGHDGLHNIQSKRSIAQQLFEIFRAVRSRVPKRVFLSRWYPTDADGNEKTKADLRKRAIDQTLDELRIDGIDLALDDPGTEGGATFAIHQGMYEALSRNDIILVDLSGVRPNVCIEAGYALKHLERGRLLLMFQPTEATQNNPKKWDDPPFDLATFRYEKFADTGEIPVKLKPHLKKIVVEAMEGREP